MGIEKEKVKVDEGNGFIHDLFPAIASHSTTPSCVPQENNKTAKNGFKMSVKVITSRLSSPPPTLSLSLSLSLSLTLSPSYIVYTSDI